MNAAELMLAWMFAPVGATAIVSRRLRSRGMACIWIGVGSVNPLAVTFSNKRPKNFRFLFSSANSCKCKLPTYLTVRSTMVESSKAASSTLAWIGAGISVPLT